jgi:hypothetical protein
MFLTKRRNLCKEAEKKVRMNLLLSVFAILGYAAD